MTTPLDLDAIVAEFLQQCGPCDFGLPYGCRCPSRDYRPPMSQLVAEVERLRERIAGVETLCRSYTPEPPPLFQGPGLSEHGIGFNAGTRTMADAVLAQLRGEDDTCPTCGLPAEGLLAPCPNPACRSAYLDHDTALRRADL